MGFTGVAWLLPHCFFPERQVLTAHTERPYGIFRPSGLYTAPICSVPVNSSPPSVNIHHGRR